MSDDYWAGKPREWYCHQELKELPEGCGPTHCLRHATHDGYCTQHWQMLRIVNTNVSPKSCVWTETTLFGEPAWAIGCQTNEWEIDWLRGSIYECCYHCGKPIERKESNGIH
jgi:hypothetical protein